MIHFTCDVCKRELEAEDDLRYVVKIEIYPALSGGVEDLDDERDHLEELQDALQGIDDGEDALVGEDGYREMRFDLCPECRRKYAKNPLGLEVVKQLQFSEN